MYLMQMKNGKITLIARNARNAWLKMKVAIFLITFTGDNVPVNGDLN